MKKKSFQLLVIGGLLLGFTSCTKNSDMLAPEAKQAGSNYSEKLTANLQPSLESDFSRAFKINNSGAIAGSARNIYGKSVAFVLKENASWFSEEEVSPRGLPEVHFSINDRGDIAGHKLVSGGIAPVLWTHDATIDLKILPGQEFGEVYDINNLGQMVGECLNGNFTSPVTMRATLFSTDDDPIDLGTLGGTKASAVAINDLGDIVGFSETGDGQSHAFLFSNGAMQDLGTLGGTFSNANSINNRGEIVGRSILANGAIRGFLYKNGVMQDLGTLGGASSVAFDVNDRGQVVGFSRVSNGQAHAFLYSDGNMQDLGTLGGIDSRAYGINNKGEIVGQYTLADGSVHGFIYKDGQMSPL